MNAMTAKTSCVGTRLYFWFEISQNNYLYCREKSYQFSQKISCWASKRENNIFWDVLKGGHLMVVHLDKKRIQVLAEGSDEGSEDR